ncbi:bifunctional riboflavin kinase/FAD synthetase [Mastigocoleus testarum]|uniref:bifunctional riboflavin kinase/FAD synthetase n=1 Tax=Mastigocoleus testarum TaxID=996925 RepID=UPI000486886E|nr:bifunctional riboflavin kinase/FAD synthetase [Mastigocoleus testarum]
MLNLSQNGCSVWVTSSTELALTPTCLALGKFDGVHRGHKRVIEPILPTSQNKIRGEWQSGREKEISDISGEGSFTSNSSLSSSHTYSTVVTFNPHPQEYFTGKPRAWLTPMEEKIEELRSLGVEQLVMLPFDKILCTLSPEDFVQRILVEQLQAARISVGEDFRFGSQRRGTVQDLQRIAARYNIPVNIVSLETQEYTQMDDSNRKERISTSLIREVLATGDMERANELLGRPYALVGKVVTGEQIGRTIGFPTANLQIPKDKFLPRKGVYAVRVSILNDISNKYEFHCLGVMNIGSRPTVNGANLSLEVHLLDWAGDLYERTLRVRLEKFLRPEQKFSGLEALKNQIQQDCVNAKIFFGSEL